MNFKYGDSWEKYPVALGDIWTCGMQTFYCGDWEAIADLDLSKAEWIYCDPPWGNGALSGFRTKASNHGVEKERQLDYLQLIDTVLGEFIASGKPCYVEMGVTWAEAVGNALAGRTGTPTYHWDVTYNGGKAPCRLLSTVDRRQDFSGMDSADLPLAAMVVEEGAVLDPFLGLGTTTFHAERSGREGIGIEMHPRRLASAIDRVAQVHGADPEKIGEFV
jgi:hypothetical protein